MARFFLVNEVQRGHDPTKPGAIYVFSSRQAVERYFEPWYVDETYLLLDESGKRHVFEAKNERLSIVASTDSSDYLKTLRKFLIYCLESAKSAAYTKKAISINEPMDLSACSVDALFKLALMVM